MSEITIDGRVYAKDLIRVLNRMVKDNSEDIVVSIRQTDGTDFPPYIAVETISKMRKNDQDGIYVCQDDNLIR